MESGVSLKEHFEKLRQSDKEAIALALTAAEKAVAVAEANAEKWRANANEWRGAMTDREKTFATKDELKAYQLSTETALKVAKERSDIGQGIGTGKSASWAILLSTVTLIGGLIAIFYALSK